MQVFNRTRGASLITQGRVADTFWLRLRGLLGVAPLREGEGLILVGEKSIHTFFMGFPIDVVYANKSGQVLRADSNMLPYRLGPFITQSAYVLEMPVGVIRSSGTRVGDQLEIES
jgi:hypothetical protein